MQAKPIAKSVKDLSANQVTAMNLDIGFDEQERLTDFTRQKLNVLNSNAPVIKLTVTGLCLASQVRVLMPLIKNHSPLKTLEFKDCNIGDELFQPIAQNLIENNTIVDLSFGNAGSRSDSSRPALKLPKKEISERSAPLINALIQKDQFKSIIFTSNTINYQVDVSQFVETILRTKNLNKIDLGIRGGSLLQDCLKAHTSLIAVRTNHASFTELSMAINATDNIKLNAIKSATIKQLATNTSVTSLTLSIPERASIIEGLCSALANNNTLQSLTFSECPFNDGFFAVLVNAFVKYKPKIITLKITKNTQIYNGATPQTLYMTDKSVPSVIRLLELKTLSSLLISDYEMHLQHEHHDLISAILVSTHLQTIKVGRYADAALALEQNRSLRALLEIQEAQFEITLLYYWRTPQLFPLFLRLLPQQAGSLEKLNCNGCLRKKETYTAKAVATLSVENFSQMLDVLHGHQQLQYLDLSDNGLTNECMPVLIAFLKKHDIIELNLSGNQFTDIAVIQLADHIGKDNRLVKLNLAENPIVSQGSLALAKEVAKNKVMLELNLSDCPFDAKAQTNFIDNITTNGSLLTLLLPTQNESTISPSYTQNRYGSGYPRPPAKPFVPAKLTKWLTKNASNKDEIILAVIKGTLLDVKRYIGLHVSPYVCDEQGNTLLHLSIINKHLPLLGYFLELGVNQKIKNDGGLTALKLAQEIADKEGDKRFVDVFSQAINRPKASLVQGGMARFLAGAQKRGPDESLPHNVTPSQPMQVDIADSRDKSDEVISPSEKKPRRDEGVKKDQPLNSTDDIKTRQFHYAALNGRMDLLQSLISDVGANAKDNTGARALHLAAKMGHVDAVLFLLAHKADVNSTDLSGQTALHLACDLNNPFDTLAVVTALLSHKDCKVDVLDSEGKTPLYCIAGHFYCSSLTKMDDKNKSEIAWLLMKNGANPAVTVYDAELGIGNMSPLLKAVMRGQYKVAKALLSSRICPINAQNDHLRTALHETVNLLSTDLVELLLTHPEINLALKDREQKTPSDLIDDKLKGNPENPEAIKIKQLLEQRRNRRVLNFLPQVQFIKSLNVIYGHRKKQPLIIEGDKEHASLKAALKLTGGGNGVTASLTFVIGHADKSRSTVTINLQGAEFHSTMAWQERVKVGSGPEQRTRSRDALQRITDRIAQAPDEAKTRCVDRYETGKPLSAAGAMTLFNNTNAIPSFEKLYHHSEDALLDFLEMRETMEIIAKQLTQKAVEGSKIYPVIILRMHSKFYLCENCELGILGEQNTRLSKFLNGMRIKLREHNYQLSPHRDLRLMVCMSAEIPTSKLYKNIQDHQDFYVDCRALYEHAILQRTFEPEKDIMTFMSRNPKK